MGMICALPAVKVFNTNLEILAEVKILERRFWDQLAKSVGCAKEMSKRDKNLSDIVICSKINENIEHFTKIAI